MKILNIYGQAFYHQEARIVGNTEGLTELRDAINQAILTSKARTGNDDPLFASDGEGYEVIVDCQNDDWGIKGGKDSLWNKEESYPEYTSLLG